MEPALHSKTEILENNYDDGPVANNDNIRDKADAYIAVYLPDDKVEKVENTSRDIYVVKGDVKLDEYPHVIAKNPTQK
jgi:hypothetical protein